MTDVQIVPIDKNQHPGFEAFLQTKATVAEAPQVLRRFSRDPGTASLLKGHQMEDIAYFISGRNREGIWLPDVAMFPLNGTWVSLPNPEGAICVEAVEFGAGNTRTTVGFLMTHILFEGDPAPRPIPLAGLTSDFMKQHRLEAVTRWGPGYVPNSGIGLAVRQEHPSNGLLEVVLPQDLVELDASPGHPKVKKQVGARPQSDWRQGFEGIGGFLGGAEVYYRRVNRDQFDVMIQNSDGTCLVWSDSTVQSQVACFNFAVEQTTYPISTVKLLWEQRPEDVGSMIRLQQQTQPSWRQKNGQGFLTLLDGDQELVAYPEVLVLDPGCNSYTAICKPQPCKLRVVEMADFRVPRPEPEPTSMTSATSSGQAKELSKPPVLSQDGAQQVLHRPRSASHLL